MTVKSSYSPTYVDRGYGNEDEGTVIGPAPQRPLGPGSPVVFPDGKKSKKRKRNPLENFSKQYWEDNPLGAFYALFPDSGQDSPYGNWLRNSYSRYNAAYQAALPMNPNLTFYDFLTKQNPQEDFANSPRSARSMRGFMTEPKVRYLGF